VLAHRVVGCTFHAHAEAPDRDRSGSGGPQIVFDRPSSLLGAVNVGAGHFGGVAGADVFVVSVRWTVDEPSGCLVVFSEVSELVLLPVSVVVVVCVRVVVVDFGGVVLPQAAASKTEEIAIERKEFVMCWATSASAGPIGATHGTRAPRAPGSTPSTRVGMSYIRECTGRRNCHVGHFCAPGSPTPKMRWGRTPGPPASTLAAARRTAASRRVRRLQASR
jgi:hypothetical protein